MILLWTCAGVSGIGGIAERLIVTYKGEPKPLTWFWFSVWVCFVVSAFLLWFFEHKELKAEKAKNENPDFRFTATNIIWDSVSSERYVTVYGRVVTRRAPASVAEYLLSATIEGKQYDSIQVDLDHLCYFEDNNSNIAPIPNMSDLSHISMPFDRGAHREGWLRFRLREAPLSAPCTEILLTVIDGFGDPHINQINKWITKGKLTNVSENKLLDSQQELYRSLTIEEKWFLKSIVEVGRSVGGLTQSQHDLATRINEKTSFLARDGITAIYTIIDQQTREILMPMVSQESPKLEITFDRNSPLHIDRTEIIERGEKVPCKLYRVAVTGYFASPKTKLVAKGIVSLSNGRTYPPLHLRVTGPPDPSRKEVQLHAGEPQLWDVIEKVNSQQEWCRLMETDLPSGFLLPIPSDFTITASCDEGISITKHVKLHLQDSGDLEFRLGES